MGTLHEKLCRFVNISRRIILSIRNASDKVLVEIKPHILYFMKFFRKSYRVWNNVEKCGRPGQATGDNTEQVFCMLGTKGSKTHTECVIFIAFPQQQSLLQSASILRYIYISCLVCLVVYYRSTCSKLCTLKPIIMLLNLHNCGSDKKASF
jgi:hypothetical protein